jgi:DNA replication protein DnaC
MEQNSTQIALAMLAKRLNVTDLDEIQEPYILTKEEEDAAIRWEVDQLRNHKAWKMRQLLHTEEEILFKLSQIDWSKEVDREEILQRTNSNKAYIIWQAEQREKEKQVEKEKLEKLKEFYTAKTMYRQMQVTSQHLYEKKLLVTDGNIALIKALCFFLSNDVRFETELGFSFKKGLLIRGTAGLGKTHLVKCVAGNELNPILVLSMIEITDEIKAEGEYDINLNGNKLIYLDDVGTEEPTVNHFGTKIFFFKNFIESYYLRNKIYNRLLISTNNSFSEIEAKYGFRVRSRMKDMFNIVEVEGQDMRG